MATYFLSLQQLVGWGDAGTPTVLSAAMYVLGCVPYPNLRGNCFIQAHLHDKNICGFSPFWRLTSLWKPSLAFTLRARQSLF